MSKKASTSKLPKSSATLIKEKTQKNEKVKAPVKLVEFILPKDLFDKLVDYLSTQTIIRLRKVCKYYQRFIDGESFWAAKANSCYSISFENFARMKAQIKVPFYRFSAFRNAEHAEQQKFIARYADKKQVLAMFERNSHALKAIVYGIFAADRLKEFEDTEWQLNDLQDELWEPALDGSVAGGQEEFIEKLLLKAPQGELALTPLFTALTTNYLIFAKLLTFYKTRGLLSPAKLQEIYVAAFLQSKFIYCNVLLPFVDPFGLESLELKSFTEKHFSYLNGKCKNSEDFRNLLYLLVRLDCREERWTDFLFENLDEDAQIADPFIARAFDEDNPNFFKFVLRKNLTTISEIPMRDFSWKHLPKTMMFLAKNKHRDLPNKLLLTAAVLPDKVVLSFMVPYIVKADKKTIDKARIRRFIEKYPQSSQYLEFYLEE